MPLSSFNGTGLSAGVRRGNNHIQRLLAESRTKQPVPLERVRFTCPCGLPREAHHLVCPECYKAAPNPLKRDASRFSPTSKRFKAQKDLLAFARNRRTSQQSKLAL